jgi:hypothetical protein
MKLFTVYKENSLFHVLSLEEKESFVKNKKGIWQKEEETLDFIFQDFPVETFIVSDGNFITNYGKKIERMGHTLINANKFFFIPSKLFFERYGSKSYKMIESTLKFLKKRQKCSISEEFETAVYTEKLFSYIGGNQQMYEHYISDLTGLINNELYLFNGKYIRKTNIIKSKRIEEEVKFLDRNVYYRLYYLIHLYEGWIKCKGIYFFAPYLNKLIGKDSEYDFLIPFSWLRMFKEEIKDVRLKNEIIIAPRIKFRLSDDISVPALVQQDKFIELYIKQGITGYLINSLKENLYTYNGNEVKFYAPFEMTGEYISPC